MTPTDLVAGSLYYVVGFDDDQMTIPIVSTYEYVGVRDSGGPMYTFENFDSQDMLELEERNLDIVLDLEGLIEMLASIEGQP